jgi:hypothetical protein
MLDHWPWFREELPTGIICLIVDQYGTQETDIFRGKAQSLGIFLLWIPKGATGIDQPLDRRVSAALKAKGRAKQWRFYIDPHKFCDMLVAESLLAESCGELSESVISTGWTFNETPVELDSDDSSDGDEFALSLNSESEECDQECFNLASEEGP